MSSQKQNKQYAFRKSAAVVIMASLVLTAALSVAAYTNKNTPVETEAGIAAKTVNEEIVNPEDVLLSSGEDGKNGIALSSAFDMNKEEEVSIIIGQSEDVALGNNKSESSDVEINIENWVKIEIDLRGKTVTKDVPAGKVSDALAYLNIKTTENDKLSAALTDEIKDGMKLTITETKTKTVTKTEKIDYKTINKDSSSLYIGETSVETEGVEGERTIVIKETYVNGQKTDSKEESNEITKEPVDKVVLNGTAEKINYFNNDGGNVVVNESLNTITDKYGNELSYSYCLSGSATAYYAPAGAGTATGRLARYGVVAVDPNEIPYGSILYIVSNDGFVYGYAVAGDTGGFIYYTDVLVDLFFPTYDDCCNFGLRNVNVYVLEGVSEDMTYCN